MCTLYRIYSARTYTFKEIQKVNQENKRKDKRKLTRNRKKIEREIESSQIEKVKEH
jgi:hypothetical protein